jgi:hypothetical protein
MNPPLAAGATSWNPFRLQQKRALFFSVSLLPRFSSERTLDLDVSRKKRKCILPSRCFLLENKAEDWDPSKFN